MADATYPLLQRRRRGPTVPRIRIGRRVRLFAVLALCLVAVLGAIVAVERQPPPGALRALADARATLEAGNYSAARNHALDAVRAEPRSGIAHAVLARAYLQLGEGLAAEGELTRARDAGLPADRTHQLLAEARLLQGDVPGALAEAAKAPPRYAAYAMRIAARAMAAKGDRVGAQAAIGRVLDADPRDAAAWTDLGRIRLDAGEVGGAADAAARAAALAPREPAALTLQGEIVRKRYGPVAALPWFDAAVARDAYYHPALIERAATLGDLGRNAAMLADSRAALAARPGSAQALYLQAVLAARAGNSVLARSLLTKANGGLENLPGALLLAGSLDAAEGKTEQAIEKWRRLVALQPMNVVARRLLGAALLRSGDAVGALDTLRPILVRGDADGYSLGVAAAAADATGDAVGAAQLRDRAQTGAVAAAASFAPADPLGVLVAGAAQAPNDPAYALGLIRGRIAAGDLAGASRQARALVVAAPGAPAAQLAWGDVLAAGGHYPDAATAYGRAADLAFDEPTMLRLVDALGRAGRQRDATTTLALYLSQNPQSLVARRLQGHLQVAAGQWDAAIDTLEGVRRTIGNRDAAVLADLARAYAGSGDGAIARSYGRAAHALRPMNADAADAYAVALDAAGDDDGARQLLDEAVALAPGDAVIAAHRRQLGG
ncbi:tetratricopeptide repeat protein [Sphingomonas sp. CROZ-RG-20F-R02-07]|uniref:tetratricopeptide repeat protein n=1 Tax=Sphingomonas sp. CROZ-RG-20F-R02-07 TaxID=2914832 RepID=UPI001F5700CE|nr:tetratricopeptide repeat protein [Sphingomonas sp. CROZ-RG-20F-R02-07]